jgi:hypothetical protein
MLLAGGQEVTKVFKFIGRDTVSLAVMVTELHSPTKRNLLIV